MTLAFKSSISLLRSSSISLALQVATAALVAIALMRERERESERDQADRKWRQSDEVWISSVEGTQLCPTPLLEDTTSLRMVTGVVRDERRILSRGGPEISKIFFFQIRIHIVLINYQPRQIPKNHCFLIY